jgi:GAF domain-containing protein
MSTQPDDDYSTGPIDARAAVAQLGRIVLDTESVDSLLQRVADLAKQVLPGVDEASVTLITNDKATTAVYTGPLALDLDESQYGRGYGPCLEAAVGGEILRIVDARVEARWPDYARSAVQRGSLSSMSVPVPVQESVHAALNLYSVRAHAFDDDTMKQAREFASYAAVALHNMHVYRSARELAENLDRAMQSRAIIEQAKGILMAQRRCDATEAFNLMAAASQRGNRKVRDLAQGIVDGVTRGSTSPH